MDSMEQLNADVTVKNRPFKTSMHGWQIVMLSLAPISLADVQRENSALFAWLTDLNHAVAQGVGRKQLLAIFDATLGCAKKYFRSVEALFEQTLWLCFQQHQSVHGRITKELEAYRSRLAGNAPLDAAEFAHVLDALLIQLILEQPLFNSPYARIEVEPVQRDESWVTANIQCTRLRRQSWNT
jgi:hypothetical protein